MRRGSSTRRLSLQYGAASSTWRSSWKSSMPSRLWADAPPMRIMGQQFSLALASPAKAWMTPGPETTRHACGRPVRYDAAWAA